MFIRVLCFCLFFVEAFYAMDVEDYSEDYILSNYTKEADSNKVTSSDIVKINVYYECLCPDCRNFDTKQLMRAIFVLNKYIDLKTYPYGNARTFVKDGHFEFKCQHGPAECYGNMLHACALDLLSSRTKAQLFNVCLMDYKQAGRGSDDLAANRCGRQMAIDPQPIKQCAKGRQGSELLRYYGDQSKSVNYTYVPFILVNGKETSADDFFRDVCSEIEHPPTVCNEV